MSASVATIEEKTDGTLVADHTDAQAGLWLILQRQIQDIGECKQGNLLPQTQAIMVGQGKVAKGGQSTKRVIKPTMNKTKDHLDRLLLEDAGQLVGTGSCLGRRQGARLESE